MDSAVMEMESVQNTSWWILILRGILAILFGMAMLLWPGITLLTAAVVFALFILVSGIVDIVSSIMQIRKNSSWWLTLLLGIVQVAAGAYIAQRPGITLAVLILVIGFVLIVRGLFEFIAAFDFQGSMRALLIVVGIITALAGVFVLRHPQTGGIAFAWLLGIYGLIAGPVAIALGIQAKQYQDKLKAKN
ncbi:DUF308 domain-containing protein [bacterium]|jgi:uncharacterized membrane protein HdeD (DUF308 family)|nr:MAG: DUF308 domain-containing protein [bacterium]